MSKGSYNDSSAQCPYYKYATEKDIGCEGCMKAMVSILRFKSKTEREKHKEEYCDARYADCNIFNLKEDEYDKIQEQKNNDRWSGIR